jgi:hypothetical protein
LRALSVRRSANVVRPLTAKAATAVAAQRVSRAEPAVKREAEEDWRR